MVQPAESQSTQVVERREITRVNQQPGTNRAPPNLEHTEEIIQSATGVEHRERVDTDDYGLEHREQTVTDVAAERELKLERASQLIWGGVAFIEALIGLRVALKLIGANPDNDFARFVYGFAGLFVGPFVGLTGTPSTGGMVLEIPSLIAMVLFGLSGWAVIRLVQFLFNRPTTRTSSTFDHYRT